jgi:hypothetical protein
MSGAEVMHIVTVSVITSILLFGLLSALAPTFEAPRRDVGRSDFNTALLRQMAARGSRSPLADSDRNKHPDSALVVSVVQGSAN